MHKKKVALTAVVALSLTGAGLFASGSIAIADEPNAKNSCTGHSACTKTFTVSAGADLHVEIDAEGGPNNTVHWTVQRDVNGPAICGGEFKVDDPPFTSTCANYPGSIAHVTAWDRSQATHDWDVHASN